MTLSRKISFEVTLEFAQAEIFSLIETSIVLAVVGNEAVRRVNEVHLKLFKPHLDGGRDAHHQGLNSQSRVTFTSGTGVK